MKNANHNQATNPARDSEGMNHQDRTGERLGSEPHEHPSMRTGRGSVAKYPGGDIYWLRATNPWI